MKKLVIIGAGGFGREVHWLADEINRLQPIWEVLGFLDDNPAASEDNRLRAPVLGPIDRFADWSSVHAVCAIAATAARRALTDGLSIKGVEWATLIHPTAVVGPGSAIGSGSVVCRNAVVSVDSLIGKHVHINIGACVGHDSVISDCVTISPFAAISGRSVVEEGAFIGSHAVLIPAARAGAWCTVGAGTVVLRNAESGTTCFGVPGRSVRPERG